jgi:hypothetical protein
MSDAAPQTLEEALRQGFKRLADVDPDLRRRIDEADALAPRALFAAPTPCGPGHTGPCSDICYPNGVRKTCYCNAAGQCDDCVFGTCTPY